MSGDSMEGTKKMVRFAENKMKEFEKTQRIIPNTDKNDKRTDQRIKTGQKPIRSASEKEKQANRRADKSEEAKPPAPPLRSILKKTAVLPMILPDLPTTEKKKKKKKKKKTSSKHEQKNVGRHLG